MPRMRVEDLMSTGVLAAHVKDLVGEVADRMHLAGIRHMPVIDDHQHVIGIVSDRDVLKAHDHGQRIAQIMTVDVQTVRPETPAFEAASMLLEAKIGSLPVVGGEEQLIGIVTETDFLEVARRALKNGF